MNYLQLINLGNRHNGVSINATIHFEKGMMVSLDDEHHILKDAFESLYKIDNNLQGQILWNDIELFDLSQEDLQDFRSKTLDFFTQETMLFNDLSVLENLELATTLIDRKDASLTLKKFELDALGQRFSGAMDEFSKFKIALIMGIIRGVKAIVFGADLLERFDENPYEMMRYCVDFFNVAIIVLNPSKNDLGYYDSVYAHDNNHLKLKYTKRLELMKEDLNDWKFKKANFDL